MSPPKARRTLVDAMVAGTPTEDEWPIIRPEENEDSLLQDDTTAVYKFDYSSSSRNSATSFHRKSAEFASKNPYASLVIDAPHHTEPSSRASPVATSYPGVLHTLGGTKIPALAPVTPSFESESPLARKSVRRIGTIAPPASMIRKPRSSLPMPIGGSPAEDTQTSTASARSIKESSTKWPLLDVGPSPQATPPSSNANDDAGAEMNVSTSTIDSTSLFDLEPEHDVVTGTRMKHLSHNSLQSGLGPVLTIAHEADTVLLGNRNPPPEVPSLPATVPGKAPHESTLSSLAGRLSRQKIRLTSMGSRPGTPESGVARTTSTRIAHVQPKKSPIESSDGEELKETVFTTVVSERSAQEISSSSESAGTFDHEKTSRANAIMSTMLALDGPSQLKGSPRSQSDAEKVSINL
jgi:hypothetical protein